VMPGYREREFGDDRFVLEAVVDHLVRNSDGRRRLRSCCWSDGFGSVEGQMSSVDWEVPWITILALRLTRSVLAGNR